MARKMTKTTSSSLTGALLETAQDMHMSGLLSDAAHAKITKRHAGDLAAEVSKPLTGPEIRTLRSLAHMSQPVFATLIGHSEDYVSKLERGVKKADGPTLRLLNVIRRKGIETIL